MLIDAESKAVIGEVCHIKSRSVGGPRHDATQSDEERNAYENVIAMCSIHHTVIDDDAESYTVERLQKIKSDHESKALENGLLSGSDQAIFLKLLDERIQLILDRDTEVDSDATNPREDPTSILQDLARKRQFKDLRREWFSSDSAVSDVIDSVNTVFTHFEDYYLKHVTDLRALDILKKSDKKGFRSLYDPKFISQMTLHGLDEISRGTALLSSIYLEIELYKKRPAHGIGLDADRCYTDIILQIRLNPDVDDAVRVVWNDPEGKLQGLNAMQVAEKIFELLVEQINSPRRLDESIPRGRYRVNGLLVDAWGNQLDEDDDLE